jgi:hypothetical protein
MSKEQKGKYEPTLVYSSLIRAIAAVRRHGIEKYNHSEDWRDVPIEDWFDALMRHSIALCLDGQTIDPDSGMPEAYMILGNLGYIIEKLYGAEHGGVQKFRDSSRIVNLPDHRIGEDLFKGK